jgi:DNA invertase Pin-like site-specific DNA recombinase
MKAALYGRVSSADGRQETENQLAELRRLAATQSWEIIGEYVDHESGANPDRAEFRRMFADAAQRRFDVLLFWALDHPRRGLETLQYLNQLSSYGVAFRSFREPYFDSCGAFSEAVIGGEQRDKFFRCVVAHTRSPGGFWQGVEPSRQARRTVVMPTCKVAAI